MCDECANSALKLVSNELTKIEGERMNLEELRELRKDIPKLTFRTKNPRGLVDNSKLNEKRLDAEMRAVVDSFKPDNYYDFED